MEEVANIKDLAFRYARGIWKHRWVGIGIAWVVLLVGVLAVDRIENRYTAEAKIYIDSSSMLQPLLQGLAIQSDFEAVVQLMIKQLLSRPNIERAIKLMDFNVNSNDPVAIEGLVNGIRSRVVLESPRRSNIYTISYTDPNREQARKMVQILLDIFIEDALGKTGTESDSAIEFLDGQIAKYDTLLREAEIRLEEFKRKNIGLMPKDGVSYYSQLQDGNRLLEQSSLLLSEAKNRREQLKLQIAEFESKQASPTIVEKSPIDIRIEEQEDKIKELLLLYTEEHPDVINATQVLTSLRQRKAEEEAAESAVQGADLYSENPVYQELQILLVSTEADISSLTTRVSTLEKEQKELRNLVDIVPKIEADLQRLNRDYEVHRKNYSELVTRREQAKISEDVESGADQVKIKIVEPPFVPLRANYPNRPLFDLAVLVAALAVGYGISLLVSLMQPVFYIQNDIRNVLATPILGSIPKFDTIEVMSKRRRHLMFFAFANICLVGVAGILTYLHMIDISFLSIIKDTIFVVKGMVV